MLDPGVYDNYTPTAAPVGVSGSSIIGYAAQQLGDPYDFGATGPDQWDCSALVQWAYRQAGIELPRDTYSQVAMPNLQTVAQNQLQPGDLVFSNWGDGPNSHVAMYAGNNTLLEAGTSGVAYTPFSASYQAHVDNYRRVPGVVGYSSSSAPSVTGSSSLLGASLGGGSATLGLPTGVFSDPLSGIANALSGIGRSVQGVGTVADDMVNFFLSPARVTLKVTLFFMGLVLIILGIWMVTTEIRD